MRIPERVLQEIVDRSDVLELVGRHVTLKRAGRTYRGLCPFHDEKTPSFTVDPDRGLFYCFGCSRGGSIFRFFMDMEGMSFQESVKFLASKAGVSIELSTDEGSGDGRTASLKELYTRLGRTFNYLLKESDQGARGREYLESRGVSVEMIDRFQLGWAPDDREWLYRFLIGKNYSAEFLNTSALFSHGSGATPLFRGRIIFPIRLPTGQIVGFGGRTIDGRQPKYINSPDSALFHKSKTLYGLDQASGGIRKQDQFILVEGYFDVIALFQAGMTNAIAPMGTSFTPYQATLIRRYSTRGVIVFDGDTAGGVASERSILSCESSGIEVEVAALPPNSDPATIFHSGGVGELQSILKSSITGFDYLLERAVDGVVLSTPDGKGRVLKSIAPFLEVVESKVRREAMLGRIAEILSVEPRSVLSDLERTLSGKKDGLAEDTNRENAPISLELSLMLAVAVNRYLFPKIRAVVDLVELKDPSARALYIAMEESYRENSGEVESAFADRVEDDQLRGVLSYAFVSGEFAENPEKLVDAGVRRLKREQLLRHRHSLETKLNKLFSFVGGGVLERGEGASNLSGAVTGVEAHSSAFAELNKLLTEKMYLDTELEKLRIL